MNISIDEIALYARHFKSFGDVPQGFDSFKKINIIIGRNNSGKSTLLDLIQTAITGDGITPLMMHRGITTPELSVRWRLNSEHVTELPNLGRSGVQHGGQSHQYDPNTWIRRIVGSQLSGVLDGSTSVTRLRSDRPAESPLHEMFVNGTLNGFAAQFRMPFRSHLFRRIAADRDVQPEGFNPARVSDIHPSGSGLTAALAYCLNTVGAPRNLVEETILQSLNEIFGEAVFTRLSASQHPVDSRWEVFLHEQHKGAIPLSQSGSGIKTILLTLANILLVPVVNHNVEKVGPNWIYGFEELENNLHPAIQRRLFSYIRATAHQTGCRFLITTHSNVVIDMFSHDEQSQILHVTHDGRSSRVNRVDDSVAAWAVLDDMDVRASDILQSNCIVWVEGPSDRLYFRKWVELWSCGKLLEGVHYQCLPFGGSCNAHLSFDDPTQVDSLIAALKLSRNALLLVDSDLSEAGGTLKPNTNRLINEIETRGGYAWLTAGREVENYIPPSILKEEWQLEEDSIQFADVLKLMRAQRGNVTEPNKADVARKVCRSLTREHLESTLDMRDHLDEVCRRIRDANGLNNLVPVTAVSEMG